MYNIARLCKEVNKRVDGQSFVRFEFSDFRLPMEYGQITVETKVKDGEEYFRHRYYRHIYRSDLKRVRKPAFLVMGRRIPMPISWAKVWEAATDKLICEISAKANRSIQDELDKRRHHAHA